MGGNVAIVGVGQTKYGVFEGRTIPEMVLEAVESALKDSRLSIKRIDSIVTASADLFDGITASNVAITEVVGAVMKSETRVSSDGLLAAFHAYMGILSGSFDIALVVAHLKESMSLCEEITNWTFDPIFQQPLGLDFLSAAGMQAALYMHKYGLREEQLAKVVVKSGKNARKNPYIRNQREITVEEVLNSRPIAYPIKLLDAKPVSDGAVAIILANDEIAGEITDRPVWIRGAGTLIDHHYLGDRDLTTSQALIRARDMAFKSAGIKDPVKEIDMAEISGAFSYQEPLWLEILGFCNHGKGLELIDDGFFDIDGDLPVNPSGGMLAGNPLIVAGLTRLAEGVIQVRGDGGERQVKGVKTALVHGTIGPCGQTQCVMIIGE